MTFCVSRKINLCVRVCLWKAFQLKYFGNCGEYFACVLMESDSGGLGGETVCVFVYGKGKIY